MQSATGRYTGDGVDDRWITVGFAPDLVVVKGDIARIAIWRTSAHSGDDCSQFVGGANVPNAIQAFRHDGFQVGTADTTNNSGTTYYWFAARRDADHDLAVGTYEGNGNDDRNITGLGFTPTCIWVKGDTASDSQGCLRVDENAANDSCRFNPVSNKTNEVQDFIAGGFQVGTSARVNADSVTYYYVAFADIAGYVETGNYTGDGVDDTQIATPFEPDFVIVCGDVVENKYLRTDRMATDDSGTVNNIALEANHIQDFGADYFEIGDDNAVNQNTEEYYWLAIRNKTVEAGPVILSREQQVMSLPTHEVWLTTDTGVRIAQLTTFNSLSASRIANAIGWINLGLEADFDTSLIKPDRMLQFWRAPRGGTLGLWRVYFIRKWGWYMQGSDEQLVIGGPDSNEPLRRRHVIAFSGSAQAHKADYADDMMKEYVTESISDAYEPTPDAGTRDWSDYLSIAADLSDGPSLTKSANFGKLLQASGGGLLSDLAKASREAGTEVFFDIVPKTVTGSSITFEFRTYTGQPGMDVSDRVTFDKDKGNLGDPFLEFDYSEEENYVYAGGQGEGEARNIQQVYDSDRYLASQWARCEGFADARQQSTDNGVREVGRARLGEGRPKRRAGGVPIDTEGTRFGIDWDFGYKVRMRYRNEEFDAIVRSVVIQIDEDGQETINARLEYES